MISFYSNITYNDTYQKVDIGKVKNIIIANDGGVVAQFSHDGSSLKGEIKPNETIELDCIFKDDEEPVIWIKAQAVGNVVPCRLWAW